MDCSSSRLENERVIEFEYNNNNVTYEDDPEIATQDQSNATKAPMPLCVLENEPDRGTCTQVVVPVDVTMELANLVLQQNFEKAFNVALQSNYVSIVSWFLSTVDLRWVVSLVPLPLSQKVLLNLLWQLACDLRNNSLQKLDWMIVAVNSMIPTNPGIAMHAKATLFQVYALLNHHSTSRTITTGEM